MFKIPIYWLQEKHGLGKIEVKDDGCGIEKSDGLVMCLPSYTSKISDFSDLGMFKQNIVESLIISLDLT